MGSQTIKTSLADSPISTEEEDLYNVSQFARSLATGIIGLELPDGAAIAINGPWGSGKSSIINLVKENIKRAGDEKTVVTEFKCWWPTDEEYMLLTFLSHLKVMLKKNSRNASNDFDEILASFAALSTKFLSFHSEGAKDLGEHFFKHIGWDKSIEENFSTLRVKLKEIGKNFLIIIDDIDRLDNRELLMMFKILKTIGNLPNVVYLLAFNRELVEESLISHNPSHGSSYLEKIIQVYFEIPLFQKENIINDFIKKLETDLIVTEFAFSNGKKELIYKHVLPMMESPRHVVRYCNTVKLTWRMVQSGVNLIDFLIMEALRLYHKDVFSYIKRSKYLFYTDRWNPRRQEAVEEIKDVLKIKEVHNSSRYRTLQYLFPTLNPGEFPGFVYPSKEELVDKGRVCLNSVAGIYFRSTL